MQIHHITARDLPDLWFQGVHDILDHGKRFTIDRGSYAGQTRLEYDYFIGHVLHPGALPLLPDIPPSIGIPNPVEEAYIYGGDGYDRSYIEYLMTHTRQEGESYTYGERLTRVELQYDMANWPHLFKEIVIQDPAILDNPEVITSEDGIHYLNQIELVIATYKNFGHRNNQMCMQIAEPHDMFLQDPPCLRTIDTRIQDGKLHFIVYFRSWDLWGGLPANLAGLQILQAYMAGEIGVIAGEMIVESKGLHLYGYAEDLAKLRCLKS